MWVRLPAKADAGPRRVSEAHRVFGRVRRCMNGWRVCAGDLLHKSGQLVDARRRAAAYVQGCAGCTRFGQSPERGDDVRDVDVVESLLPEPLMTGASPRRSLSKSGQDHRLVSAVGVLHGSVDEE